MRIDAVRAAWVLVVALSMGSCGQGAEDHLAAAARTVGEIKSGVLDMRLSIAPTSSPETPIGFTIEGPFEVNEHGLEADLRYRQVAGSNEAAVRFVAADGRAFVEAGGSFYELPVVDDASAAKAPSVLQDLSFESWAADPSIVDAERSGQMTIVSPLDEAAALEGLRRLLDELDMKEASGLAVFDGLDEEAVERSVRDGTMTVRVGEDDDLLRSLIVRLRFAIDPSSPLAEALEGVAGAELTFSVDIQDPNEPIHVEAPQDAAPISELPGA
jgi:hypothetical protein